jgi:hypothetical protein
VAVRTHHHHVQVQVQGLVAYLPVEEPGFAQAVGSAGAVVVGFVAVSGSGG